MRLKAGSAFFCVALGACASQPPAPDVPGADLVAVVDHIQGTPVMLKRITVAACAPTMGSPMPTQAEALPLLKEKAASLDATAILRAKYKPAGLFDGCGLVPALRATGIAFRVAP
jgi:hypothetical protein